MSSGETLTLRFGSSLINRRVTALAVTVIVAVAGADVSRPSETVNVTVSVPTKFVPGV